MIPYRSSEPEEVTRLREFAAGRSSVCDPIDVALVLNWLDEACDCRRFEQARDAAEPHHLRRPLRGDLAVDAPGGALDQTLAAEEGKR